MSETDDSTATEFDHRAFLKNVSSHPGVYRMFNDEGEILYVGKAKNLKNRLSSYFRNTGLSSKTQSLVNQIQHIETTVTHTEGEALLLESNLIKEHRPRYNILLRDDKSYPYLYVSTDQDFPRISLYRGTRKLPGKFLGPYPSAGALRESLNFIHKTFRTRQCEDSYFNHRTRPCLQYQIRRCTAPCVGYISKDDYAQDLEQAMLFLQGKNTQLIESLAQTMETAAEQLDYEKAAVYRDRLQSLQKIIEKQYVSSDHRDADVLACVSRAGQACVQVFSIREGRNLGNRSYFPRLPEAMEEGNVLQAFVSQYYLNRDCPPELVLSHDLPEQSLMETMLSEQHQHRVKLSTQVRSDRQRWLGMALQNAETALSSRLASNASILKRYEDLQERLQLDSLPERLECFDISHTQGESTVASCVVFNLEGPAKQDYRRFNIEGIEPGDDYGAMRQALQRRYARLKKGEGKLPDILFIDGGKGQLRQAVEVLDQLNVDNVLLVGVAKGEGRKAGLEKLVFNDGRGDVYLPADSPGFHLILNLRDEAHRFAITGHRKQRAQSRKQSLLESIPGLGPKRRQNLIRHFGGIQGVKRAGVEDLQRIPGISRKLAQIIYDELRTR